FQASIRENLEIGKPGASDLEVERVLEAACALDFVKALPDGWNSKVGERGVRLSAGERQRLSIARALLKDPPVLILDEATSALDSESERAVQAALETLMKGRTTLTIAHRLSTVMHADRIVVMHAGRIVESGTHTNLLAHNGLYARLCQGGELL
ncbi:MAG: ATP-binding cassette domain-containing protein, partial [Betaproteobacteria bacterium]|nr:ATP-binding cassette domain-containing protein [Betaproteobacteria bacterium]